MKIPMTLAAAGTLLMAGCSTVPTGQNLALETARAHYLAAAEDPMVLRAAPVELSRARENLERAEAAWQEGDDVAQVNHLAYLAGSQALIANERGRLARAEQVIETASAERNQVLLENRDRLLAMERENLARQGEELALAQDRARAAAGVAAEQAQRAAQLQKELEELSAKQTPIGMVMTLGDVLFDVGKATLKPGAERSLDQLAEFLKKHPERKVRVEGFTDATGSAETNQQLSRQRAQEVRTELTSRGISPDRVEAVGYGESFPIASNDSAAGRQQNRRVEIVISDEAGNVSRR